MGFLFRSIFLLSDPNYRSTVPDHSLHGLPADFLRWGRKKEEAASPLHDPGLGKRHRERAEARMQQQGGADQCDIMKIGEGMM